MWEKEKEWRRVSAKDYRERKWQRGTVSITIICKNLVHCTYLDINSVFQSVLGADMSTGVTLWELELELEPEVVLCTVSLSLLERVSERNDLIEWVIGGGWVRVRVGS